MGSRSWFWLFLLTLLFLFVFFEQQIFAQLQSRFVIWGDGSANLGSSVAGTGDVNGDGIPDFIVGAPSAGEYPYYGEAYVYSGENGALLYEVKNTGAFDALGWSVAGAGDVNGDGYADFIAGAPFADPGNRANSGSVNVYSGKDGDLLYQLDGVAPGDFFGRSVAGAGDVNGDGKADFIIGAVFAKPNGLDSTGAVYVYSGSDGSLLFQINGSQNDDRFGWSVAGMGDLNGDGKADFVVGAPYADAGGLVNSGSVYVYSGVDGSLLYQLGGSMAGILFGFSVDGDADLNEDGNADLIIGAPYAGSEVLEYSGEAYVYSGTNGSFRFQSGVRRGDISLTGREFGYSVAVVGDINKDGTDDFLVGAPSNNNYVAGSYFIISGATGARLYEVVIMFSPTGLNDLGSSVAGIGDIDGDSKPDIIIGAPRSRYDILYERGAAFVYTADIVPPVISCPAIVKKRVCPGGESTSVVFNPTATDFYPPEIVCFPASGSAFPVGAAAVTCITSDVSGNKDSCSFNVSVFPCLEDTVLQCGDSVLTFPPELFNSCPGAFVACMPPSGSIYPVGVTAVTCVATDTSGNQDTCRFNVTVVRDMVPPLVQCPTDVVRSQCNPVVNYTTSYSDNCSGSTLSCTPPSGYIFPAGITPVTCTAVDAFGNENTCQFNVTIVADTVPPAIQCEVDIPTRALAGQCGRTVEYGGYASDNCGSVTWACSPPSGSFFPIGETVITCQATDPAGNRSACTFAITVNTTRGDMNADATLTAADVMLLLNCIFMSTGSCGLCVTDVNCSGDLSPADVVLELNRVFLSSPLPC